ncbi:phasin family protein [Mangrovicoccus sp. HB161399]|uniref:phasin family protein n=1 Tax=Mangrovicoccus sp. HB161399 TaxID=2720392 RepID=UPI00210F8C62|nr:phasin family protein [Mangrovicoccus sp. HB161399]
MARTTDRGVPADCTVLTAWSALQQTGMTTAATAMDIWMNTVNAMYGNYIAFLNERTQQNLAAVQHLLGSQNAGEFLAWQQDFAEKALESCRDESEELAEMAESGMLAMAREARGGGGALQESEAVPV